MHSPQKGKQSIEMPNPVYIRESAAVVGTKEGEGPLGELFDLVGSDDMMGCDNWEEAESTLQKEALSLALGKAGMAPKDLRYLLAGDLLAQSVASSYALMDFETPILGVYGACSTCGEALGIGSMVVSGGYADTLACVTSSHFASAEKEFRFPLSYGSQRPKCSTWTVTGSGAYILTGQKQEKVLAQITGITSGKIMDYGIKDSFNMGCCMAPAACDTIYQNLQDFGRRPEDYDRIFTGDLGNVGQTALFDLLEEKGIDITKQHLDCGMLIFDSDKQNTEAGGSGCGCAATVLSAYILPKITSGEWKRVLFVPTGALLSKTSFNEGQTIPGIAHGVVIEHVD